MPASVALSVAITEVTSAAQAGVILRPVLVRNGIPTVTLHVKEGMHIGPALDRINKSVALAACQPPPASFLSSLTTVTNLNALDGYGGPTTGTTCPSTGDAVTNGSTPTASAKHATTERTLLPKLHPQTIGLISFRRVPRQSAPHLQIKPLLQRLDSDQSKGH